MSPRQPREEKQAFEKTLEELEKIVQAIESGEIGLEEAVVKFEKGMKLSRDAEKRLSEIERRIELIRKGPSGEVRRETPEA